MTLRDAFMSKVAAATLVAGLAYGGAALAQETPAAGVTPQEATTLTSNLSVTFDPLIPYGALGGLGAMALLLSGWAASRRMQGWPLRTAFASVSLLALANPEILIEERQSLTTEVAVVVDRSPSQTIGNRNAVTAAMQEELLERLRAMPGVNVRLVEAGGAAQGPVDGTHVFSALETAFADVPPERVGGTFVLTDGQVHDVPGSAPAQLGGAPVHVLVSGSEAERDRRIVMESAPLYGVVDEDLTFRFRVVDSGVVPGAGAPVRVTISADGRVLETRDVTPGEISEFTMKVPHGGPNLIEMQAAALEGELTEVNNRVAATVEGVRDRLRVLLVSGQPTFAERTLRNLLKSDPALDLIHFTILRPADKQDGTPTSELALIAFPTQELFEQKLEEFDLIVFDRVQQQGIIYPHYFGNIARYIQNGGAMMVVSGPEYAFNTSIYNTPLRESFPAAPAGRVIEAPFRPEISDLGRRHPVTRDLAPPEGETPDWGRWFRQVEVRGVTGHAVMEGSGDRPLLVLRRQGEGRVAHLLSDSLGLWSRGFEGGGPYADLMQRTAHWLMGEYDLEEEALRLTADRGGEITIERQTMSDTSAPVTLIAPSGRSETVTLQQAAPGLFRATVPATEMGTYRVEQGGKFAFTNVGPANPQEFIDPRSTTEVLAPIAEQTGGLVARMAGDSGVLSVPAVRARDTGTQMTGADWAGVRMTEASVLKSASQYPLLSGLMGLALVLGALSLAWYREGDGKFLPEKKTGRGGPGGPAPG